MIVFGPVPSRRLGKSLGINNIPFKYCSYSCAYCQLGSTKNFIIERRKFYKVDEIFAEVQAKVTEVQQSGETIDYLTFVPDGEPTLDENLGIEIEMLRTLMIPIAVITNSSLLSLESVIQNLAMADLVSVKIDTVNEQIFHRLDRPHPKLNLNSILEGVRLFSERYKGKLITETMLVKGINDSPELISETARFIREVDPKESYISIPIRPPQDRSIAVPDAERLVEAYQLFTKYLQNVSLLSEAEVGSFSSTGDIANDILSIISVHPMREEKVVELIKNRGESFAIVETLIKNSKINRVDYNDQVFYIRNFVSGGKHE